MIDGAVVKSVQVESQETGDLVLRCEWEAPGYATPAGKRLILNPRAFSRISVDDWAQESRESPIHLRGAYETIDTFTLSYPDGVTAVELPRELKFEVKGVGVYEMRYRQEDRTVVAVRKMRLDRYSFPPTAYPTLKKWMSKVAESDDSPIVLTLQ